MRRSGVQIPEAAPCDAEYQRDLTIWESLEMNAVEKTTKQVMAGLFLMTLAGSADAMLSLFSPDDKSLDGLLALPEISLVPTPSTQAVAGRLGYLVAGNLPQGAVSVARNIPPTDLPAVAVPITVIANSTISRAAAYDIAQVLSYRFGRATVLAGPDEFPKFLHYLPSDPAAADYYASGVIPWQYRLLAAPIADLFIPIAVIGTIILLVFSIYGALLPSVYEAWVDRVVPHVRAKREKKAEKN